MAKPFFTIVTAIKDGLDFFTKTAPTVINQTCIDWEWIVVDDGSEQPIGEFVELLQDPRIHYYRNEVPLGQTRSLNFGIDRARAHWIVRMDGDDLADRRRLELTKDAILKQGAEIKPLIFSDYHVIGEDGARLTTVRYSDPLSKGFYSYLDKNNPICHPSVTFYKYSPKNEVYHFDENLRNAQDYALWKRLRRDYGESFVHLPEPLISYRLVLGALSGARIAEQRLELKAIRGAQLRGHLYNELDAPVAAAVALGTSQQRGMYAFRVLYYRFIGDHGANLGGDDFSTLAETARYPSMLPRSLFFLALRPFKAPLKNVLFGKIYR